MKVKKLFPVHLLFVFLFLEYLFLIWGGFKSALADISPIFGYLDYQNNWRALDDFIKFKTPFKDYFFEYGWFFLFIQSVGYLIFGKTFLALLISRYLYLPILGVILSFFIARNVLQKGYLIFIFLFFTLLFRTTYDLASVKHLLAELSLSFIILFFLEKRQRYLLVSGIIAGLAFLTALEYGIALNAAVILIFVLTFFSQNRLRGSHIKKFYFGQLMVLVPYFLWLYANGAIVPYFQFTWGFINNFYYTSPCSVGSFPRFTEITVLASYPHLVASNVLMMFLKRLNFYIVAIFFVVFIINSLKVILERRRIPTRNLIQSSLAIYGLLIFVRTLDNPCTTYFVYGLVPFFLLLTLLIQDILRWIDKNNIQRIKVAGFFFIFLIFFWIRLTENTEKAVVTKIDPQNSEYYPEIDWFLTKELAEDYRDITDYIYKNTKSDDYLYVYPWGPYNNLTGRKAPTAITNVFQFIAGKEFITKTRQELELKNPKLVIINIYNNLGKAHYGRSRGDTARYFSVSSEDGPVFSGEGNEVEKFILENYKVSLVNTVGIVMSPREKPIKIEKPERKEYTFENWENEDVQLSSMRGADQLGRYAIIGGKASWSFSPKNPIEASDVVIEFRLDGNILTKHLTRYLLNFTVVIEDDLIKPYVTIDLATKEWQVVKVPLNKVESVKMIKIEIGDNTGLAWWLNPSVLQIRKIDILK